MRELDKCLELAREIKDKEDDIQEIRLRKMSAKNQIITDMPRGGGLAGSAMDDYLVKLEKLEKAKKRLETQLCKEWEKARLKFVAKGIIKKEPIDLMRFRFFYGLPWKVCAGKMKARYPDSKWNINKCFRTYRNILHKINAKI